MCLTLSRDPTAAALSAFILEETGGAAEEETEEDESEVRRCRLTVSKPVLNLKVPMVSAISARS